MRELFVPSLLASGVLATSALGANLIVNGSFEQGPEIPGRILTVTAPDSTTLVGWTVSNNDLEIVTPIEWPAAEGSRSIDLNGGTNATMYQDVNGLLAGTPYRLTFSLSGNPFVTGDPIGEADVIKDLRVSAAGASQDYAFDVTPFHTQSDSTVPNMGWRIETFDFVPGNSTVRLQFASLDPSNSSRGPAIDNVTLSVIPEPTAIVLLATGSLIPCRATRRKRRFSRVPTP